VKDIGDAVMASFADSQSAVRAALAMHDVVRKIGGLQVKVGLHCGPDELCLSDAVYRRAAELLAGLPTTSFEARVRGIDEPIVTHRIAV
jgi:class 3 adenylate cyclase